MNRASLIAAALVVGLGVHGAAWAQTAEATGAADPIIAIVNGEEIPMSHVSMLYASLPEQYRQMPIDMLYEQLLEGLIDRKLLAQAARQAGLADSPDVRQRLDYVIDDVLQDAYLSDRLEAEMTEERLRAAYEAGAADQPSEEEASARHILLETEEEAVAVIAELQAGADFAEVAREKSTGPSASTGGDLGYFSPGQMVPEFSEAVFSLQPGEITTTPVKTQFGWHVIKVEDRRTSSPPTFEEASPALRNQEAQSVIIAIMDGLRNSAEVKRFDAEGNELPAVEQPVQ